VSVLILGGAGYIGSHAARAFLESGKEVVVADSLETGYRAAVPADARFYQGSICDRTFCDRLFEAEPIDAVIHFAACSLVGESMEKPLKYYANNLGGTRVLLESMVAHGVRNLVFSSTAAVYGEPEHIPISETDGKFPTNCYGETKLAIEKLMGWVSGAHDLRFVALRYFNAAGAQPDGSIGEAHSPETHLIPIVLQVANGQRAQISIFGDDYDTPDGTCVRDYVHVCDLAQAHLLALSYLEAGGQSDVFNLGSGAGYSVREVLETAREVTGQPIPAVVCPRRAGDPARLIASSEKARRVLGWQPRCDDLTTIVKTAWAWHSRHPRGYSD
jgi:UDP-glucose 4-epimerase